MAEPFLIETIYVLVVFKGMSSVGTNGVWAESHRQRCFNVG